MLAALGLADAVISRPRPAFVMPATALLCGLGALMSLLGLLDGGGAQTLALPIGLPGVPMVLALDGLSGFFLLVMYASATACAGAAWRDGSATAGCFPALTAAMALALLAADAFTLVLGLELALVAAALLAAPRQDEPADAAQACLGVALLAGACLIPAFSLMAPAGPGLSDPGFAAIRMLPPLGWHANLAMGLVLVGAGAVAGLFPLHAAILRAQTSNPAHVSALMAGGLGKVAIYILARMLFDLCGTAQPLWWAVPLLVMGAAGAVLGNLRATQEPDIKGVLASGTVANVGLIAIGLGVAQVGRATDLAALTSLALAGCLLHAMVHSLGKTLLFLASGAVQAGAGSRRLEFLGGLIHRMPVTTACVMAGAVATVALPPGAGFASAWLVLQSLLGAARTGGLAMQVLLAVTVASLGLALALGTAAAVRLIGVAFLGRPRAPRGAAATEAPLPTRIAMIVLGAITIVIGILPGWAAALTDPALRLLTTVGLADRAGPLALTTQLDVPGYSAVGTALLLAICGGGLWLLARNRMARGERRAAAWAGGFAATPDWLPFGDPLTQYSGASFAQPLAQTLGHGLLAARATTDAPLPSDSRSASHAQSWADPAQTWIIGPAARLRIRLSTWLERLHPSAAQPALVVMACLLVLLLIAVAWVGA